MAAIRSGEFHRSSSSEGHFSPQHQIPSSGSSQIEMEEKRKREEEIREENGNDDCIKDDTLWIDPNLVAPFSVSLTCKSLIKSINEYCLSRSSDQDQSMDPSTPIYQRALSRFYRRIPPEISIYDYLIRIVSFLPILEPAILLSIVIYSNRDGFARSDTGGTLSSGSSSSIFILDKHSWHRFIIAVICLASKALGDYYYTNTFYAKVGGISPKELRLLELELAERLEWHLQVEQSEFGKAFEMINREN
jgi:hypothetical protein